MYKYRPKYTTVENLYDLHDKKRTACDIIDYMLDRTQSIFKYTNMPDTLKIWLMELKTQTKGHIAITKVTPNNGQKTGLYGFIGGFSGEPDVDLLPYHYIIANPCLDGSLDLEIDKDVVILKNDTLMKGLLPIFNKYATLISENELSLKVMEINSRIPAIITADNDQAAESAKAYIADIEKGKNAIIAQSAFLEGVKTEPYAKENSFTDLIELEQYLKASLFNEIGLDSNYNMKRESLNSAESQMNDDALLPLIDDMLRNRQEALKKLFELWPEEFPDGEPTVELASSWRAKQEEIEQIIEDDVSDEPVTDEEITEESKGDVEDEQKQEDSEENDETEDNSGDAAEDAEDETKAEITIEIKTDKEEDKDDGKQ